MGDDIMISNSLGGSLMKDLLEDLALGDDDFLSLDQLEKELQEMENLSNFEVPLTAAGLIVQQQQNMNSTLFGEPPASSNSLLFAGAGSYQPLMFSGDTTVSADNPVKTLDAWSLSLQNFSGTSYLQEDFLHADSVRKQQQQQKYQTTATVPPPGLENLPEYDISEPPPGMRAARVVQPPGLVEQAAEILFASQKLPNDTLLSSIPEPVMVSPPPHTTPLPLVLPMMIPEPRNSTTTRKTPVASSSSSPMMTTPWKKIPPPTPYSTPQSSVGMAPPPPVLRPRIYANPHPSAEPVPATNIPSQYMTPRDLCFVVHAILKPILTQNARETCTYHLEYWMRHHPAAPPVMDLPKGSGNEQELASRSAKATEWSKENKVLGTTSKSAVTRPRALIAVVVSTDEEETENERSKQNQHRAALWKARVRCDQGYACFTQLQSSAAARIKLLKCFGVQNGNLDVSIFQGVLKLAKGRTLLARTLEMYPEVIPMFLLPATITLLTGGSDDGASHDETGAFSKSGSSGGSVVITDNRLCSAWARVIASASDETVLAQQSLFLHCVQIVVERGSIVLQDTSHMMIGHSLLQRATAVAATNEAFAQGFSPLEAKFMDLLSTE
jgi:hypothetical protein